MDFSTILSVILQIINVVAAIFNLVEAFGTGA